MEEQDRQVYNDQRGEIRFSSPLPHMKHETEGSMVTTTMSPLLLLSRFVRWRGLQRLLHPSLVHIHFDSKRAIPHRADVPCSLVYFFYFSYIC